MPSDSPGSTPSASAEAFRFVQELATAVNGPPLELPSYPEVSLRIQRVLSDADASAEKVVRLIGTEPLLAARVIAMANSAALCRGSPTSDLKGAVSRVGFSALRSAAIGFSQAQLRKAQAYQAILQGMGVLWQNDVETAAMSYVLARSLRRVSPDAAMLTGLVSGVGKLYLLTRRTRYPLLFSGSHDYAEVEREWHPQVARSILENWALPEETVEAVAGCEEAASMTSGRSPLSDVLAVALTLVDARRLKADVSTALQSHRAALRLGVSASSIEALVAESAAEMASLREALGH